MNQVKQKSLSPRDLPLNFSFLPERFSQCLIEIKNQNVVICCFQFRAPVIFILGYVLKLCNTL
jgi:hypothetical protein